MTKEERKLGERRFGNPYELALKECAHKHVKNGRCMNCGRKVITKH